jgi:hypothetical protein
MSAAAAAARKVAGHVLSAARDPSQQSEHLRREVSAFLTQVRAAQSLCSRTSRVSPRAHYDATRSFSLLSFLVRKYFIPTYSADGDCRNGGKPNPQ